MPEASETQRCQSLLRPEVGSQGEAAFVGEAAELQGAP